MEYILYVESTEDGFDDLLWKNKPYPGLSCAFSVAPMYSYI
jgi:hypothetical protein